LAECDTGPELPDEIVVVLIQREARRIDLGSGRFSTCVRKQSRAASRT
jgi:hypothetical protein